MSYILDALRKADQQRHRGAAPTLMTVQPAPAPPRRQALPVNVLLAAVLVSAGIAIGWLRPWQPAPAAIPAVPGPVRPNPRPASPVLPATAAAPAVEPDREVAKREAAAREARGQEPAPAATSAPVAPIARMPQDGPPASALVEAPPGSLIIAPTGAPTPITATPAGSGTEAAVPAQKAVALEDLPPSVRQEIPRLTISFHVYTADPADRRVIVNDQLLVEGDLVAPGLRLEQITPDGVILGYRGYRIRRGVR
jgi:general secretion pathway protein B